MERRTLFAPRPVEAALILIVATIAALGFLLAGVAGQLLPIEADPAFPPAACLAPLLLAVSLFVVHWLMRWRKAEEGQLVWPLAGLLVAVGMVMIFRLPTGNVSQQLLRGWLPGVAVVAVLVLWPRLVELIRRHAIWVSVGGLLLLLATALFGVVDETGARLALKIGPLPALQTSELTKLALIIFLAWYIERVGEEAEGRARPVGWLRLPSYRYFIPGLLFVAIATLALVRMSDFGAILIIASLFVAMFYAGFRPRVFATVALIGLALSLVMGIFLALFWTPPDVLTHRFTAFRDPFSDAPLVVNGVETDVTIAEGPGYQIQQAIFALTAGGLTGTGLGFGSPYFVPLSHSDFIFAAIVEEYGGLVALALLSFMTILLLRLLRLGMLLPAEQVFERLLLVGIAVHLFMQVFVMVGGTFNLLPLTGITVPFLSQGGIALLVNLTEIGLALALAQRLT